MFGHTYHFFEKAREFAKKQPRKYLWERNAYFYTRDGHGSWDRFVKMVDKEMTSRGEEGVWGPVHKDGIDPTGPLPPVDSSRDDKYSWGVGEEADFITFLPIFDPTRTGWVWPDLMWNLDPANTPRRTAVVTMCRVSKLLLDTIHDAQINHGWGIASEMTPATFALWNSLKAVHIPHPIYMDGQWTPKEVARIMNKGSVENMNGDHDSIWNYNHAFDHIMLRTTYMFKTRTAEDLFRLWMGFKVDENQATDGHPVSESISLYRPC
jgi:hypothetical protein